VSCTVQFSVFGIGFVMMIVGLWLTWRSGRLAGVPARCSKLIDREDLEFIFIMMLMFWFLYFA
jgi:hypothetical protein